jgi:hypothetical protein
MFDSPVCESNAAEDRLIQVSAVSRELRFGWDACPRKPNDAMGTICVPPAANQLRLLEKGSPPLGTIKIKHLAPAPITV